MVGMFWIYLHLILVGILHDGDAIEHEIIAPVDQFRYMACIQTPVKECGGAILDENHILTAAHCVNGIKDKDISIITGDAKLLLCWRQIYYRKIEKKYIHPNFDRRDKNRCLNSIASIFRRFFMSCPRIIRWKNDIAVLTLRRPLLFGNRIMKVNLPQTGYLPFYRRIYYASWHLTIKRDRPKLQYIELMILPFGDCSELDRLYRENEFYGISLTDNYNESLVYDGSPLVEGNAVHGITSRGESGVIIFTRVVDHLDFILKAMNATDYC